VNVLINVFVIVIGYNGLNQKIVLNYYQVGKLLHHDSLEKKDIQDDLMDKDAAELPAIVPADTYREELYQKLCRLMDNEKPYLDPELTLEKLARKMEMPAYLLSQIINTLGQSNFFDFINHYRVNEVIQQIHENKNRTVTLISIAIDAGFNSKTSFNRAFKKKCLCTPKEYIKKCQIL
jgi:AraC-like DNA-binding protein